MKKIILLFTMMISLMIGLQAQNIDYFGQKGPGDKPLVFAPGVISTSDQELYISFSDNGKLCTFYRRTNSPRISSIKYLIQKGRKWLGIKDVPYLDFKTDGYFMLEPFKKILYFASKRPFPGTVKKQEKRKLWKMDFKNQAWLKPDLVDLCTDTDQFIGHPTFTRDGTVYFYSEAKKGGLDRADIFFSRFKKGKYGAVQNPGPGINTDADECDAFVDPDERYMLLAVKDHPGCLGNDFDIFISFKKKDGGWTQAVNLGKDINSTGREIYPRVSPDGKYIFFGSNRSGNWDIYWVDSGVLKEIKKKHILP